MITMRYADALLVALVLSLPTAVLAEEKPAHFRARSSVTPSPISPAEQPGPAIGYHNYMPPPAQSYDSGSQQRLEPSRPHPHGHRPHVHVVPIWRVSFYPQPLRTGQAMLQILVTAVEGELYLDAQYLGSIANLQGRPVDVTVLPGRHVVYVVHRGNTYPYAVDVEADFTAVVQANLP